MWLNDAIFGMLETRLCIILRWKGGFRVTIYELICIKSSIKSGIHGDNYRILLWNEATKMIIKRSRQCDA